MELTGLLVLGAAVVAEGLYISYMWRRLRDAEAIIHALAHELFATKMKEMMGEADE